MSGIKITVDQDSGFCFGVKRAIEMAETQLEKHDKLYCLGDIVHNTSEIRRLSEKGLITAGSPDLKKLRSGRVLFRAHGEPPSSYTTIKENSLELTDATCPIVKKLQEKVKKAWDYVSDVNGQLVIYGNPDHPEIIGLQGQTGDSAIIVSDPGELSAIDPSKPVELFSQTTKSPAGYNRLEQNLRTLMKKHSCHDIPLRVHNTICGQISRRLPLIREFAGSHDVIIFVGGNQSSNAKVLFGHCKEVNPNSRFISLPEEVEKEWFWNASTAGVCGATSTPQWLMEKVAERIAGLTEKM